MKKGKKIITAGSEERKKCDWYVATAKMPPHRGAYTREKYIALIEKNARHKTGIRGLTIHQLEVSIGHITKGKTTNISWLIGEMLRRADDPNWRVMPYHIWEQSEKPTFDPEVDIPALAEKLDIPAPADPKETGIHTTRLCEALEAFGKAQKAAADRLRVTELKMNRVEATAELIYLHLRFGIEL